MPTGPPPTIATSYFCAKVLSYGLLARIQAVGRCSRKIHGFLGGIQPMRIRTGDAQRHGMRERKPLEDRRAVWTATVSSRRRGGAATDCRTVSCEIGKIDDVGIGVALRHGRRGRFRSRRRRRRFDRSGPRHGGQGTCSPRSSTLPTVAIERPCLGGLGRRNHAHDLHALAVEHVRNRRCDAVFPLIALVHLFVKAQAIFFALEFANPDEQVVFLFSDVRAEDLHAPLRSERAGFARACSGPSSLAGPAWCGTDVAPATRPDGTQVDPLPAR